MFSKLGILLETHSMNHIHILCRLIRRNHDEICKLQKSFLNPECDFTKKPN